MTAFWSLASQHAKDGAWQRMGGRIVAEYQDYRRQLDGQPFRQPPPAICILFFIALFPCVFTNFSLLSAFGVFARKFTLPKKDTGIPRIHQRKCRIGAMGLLLSRVRPMRYLQSPRIMTCVLDQILEHEVRSAAFFSDVWEGWAAEEAHLRLYSNYGTLWYSETASDGSIRIQTGIYKGACGVFYVSAGHAVL